MKLRKKEVRKNKSRKNKSRDLVKELNYTPELHQTLRKDLNQAIRIIKACDIEPVLGNWKCTLESAVIRDNNKTEWTNNDFLTKYTKHDYEQKYPSRSTIINFAFRDSHGKVFTSTVMVRILVKDENMLPGHMFNDDRDRIYVSMTTHPEGYNVGYYAAMFDIYVSDKKGLPSASAIKYWFKQCADMCVIYSSVPVRPVSKEKRA